MEILKYYVDFSKSRVKIQFFFKVLKVESVVCDIILLVRKCLAIPNKDYFNQFYQRLMQRKNINIVDKGYVRKLEVTYNLELVITDDLYYRQKEY